MPNYLTAEEARARLQAISQDLFIVDGMWLSIVAARMNLSGEVAATKFMHRDEQYPNGEPISRPEIEAERLNAIAERAPDYGVDPNLARTLLSILIDHGCKQQMIRWQGGEIGEFGEFSYEELKANLRILTAVAAGSYHEYDRLFPATQAYREYELGLIMGEVERMSEHDLCLDIGCGGGRVALAMAPHFKQVLGVDLSPEMVEVANWAASTASLTNAKFVTADFEEQDFWDSLDDNSCDLATMALGTASDTKEIRFVLNQLSRVLKPGGRFVLSFYNAEGLVQRWGFLPWTPSLAAKIDVRRNCLDVNVGHHVYSIYAQPYNVDEVNELVNGRLQVLNFHTYPTLASVLPREVLANELVASMVATMDLASANGSNGAYIIAVGRK